MKFFSVGLTMHIPTRFIKRHAYEGLRVTMHTFDKNNIDNMSSFYQICQKISFSTKILCDW